MWLQGTPGTDKYTVQIHADMRISESQRNTSWLYSTIQYYTVSKQYCVSGYHLHKLGKYYMSYLASFESN